MNTDNVHNGALNTHKCSAIRYKENPCSISVNHFNFLIYLSVFEMILVANVVIVVAVAVFFFDHTNSSTSVKVKEEK